MQVILIKYNDSNSTMKAKLMISDGNYAIMALLSQEAFERMVILIIYF